MIATAVNTLAELDEALAHLNAEAKAIKVKDSPRAIDLHREIDGLLDARRELAAS